MAHTYASVPELKDFIKDSGSSTTGGLGTVNDTLFLTWLEDASRSIDEFCARTDAAHPVSGFGPRTGTNRYDGPARHGTSDSHRLQLDDDLLSLTSVSVLSAIGATAETYTSETDFYLGPYDRTPYREMDIHGDGLTTWYATRRGISVVGKWGYVDERVTSTTTLGAAITTTTATSITTSASPTIQVGQTLLIDSEQLYLTALSGTTGTVVRGANGTTAATHLNAAAIDVYRYPRSVAATCMRLAFRRWKQRDAGLTGAFGGGQMPVTTQPDPSEMSVLRNGVGAYALLRLS